jgi:hypothetical protein
MTLKELKDIIKDFPDDIADKLILAIGIRDEKDIIEKNGYISFPEFSERFNVDSINTISEGTMAPKLFFIGNRKRKES